MVFFSWFVWLIDLWMIELLLDYLLYWLWTCCGVGFVCLVVVLGIYTVTCIFYGCGVYCLVCVYVIMVYVVELFVICGYLFTLGLDWFMWLYCLVVFVVLVVLIVCFVYLLVFVLFVGACELFGFWLRLYCYNNVEYF